MKIDLTDEERGAVVHALTLILVPITHSVFQPFPNEDPHTKRIRIIAYSAFEKMIGMHHDQVAVAGSYQI